MGSARRQAPSAPYNRGVTDAQFPARGPAESAPITPIAPIAPVRAGPWPLDSTVGSSSQAQASGQVDGHEGASPNAGVDAAVAGAAARPWHAVGHRENFPVASWLIPSDRRAAVVAIYRFARTADDIADEGVAPAAERIAGLDRLGRALDAAATGRPTGIAVVDALPAFVRRHRLGWQHLHDLLSAFRQDTHVKRYADPQAVQDYCERSANPIGRLMLELFDSASPDNIDAADAICSALQKINFCQDVAVDWAKDRVYLPLGTLADQGIAPADLARELGAASYSPALRAAIAHEAARARRQLLSGRRLFGAVPLRLSLELRAIVAGGLRILDRTAAVDHDVAARRPHLGWRDIGGIGQRLLFPR